MRYLMLLLLAALLMGCERNTPQAVLEHYAERVAQTLEHPLPSLPAFSATRLPDRRDRRLATVEIRAGLLDALDLAQCNLLPLISERNSILGKVKPPSAVLSYELRFFDRLNQCYLQDQQQPLEDAEFSNYLAELHRIKQANLYPVWWNAVFTSDEIERNLSLSKPPLPLEGHPGYSSSLQALQTLLLYRQAAVTLAEQPAFQIPAGLEQLEQHYFALYASEYGGQLFSSLVLLTRQLERVATLIEQSERQRPVCLSGRPVPRARHLRNVLERFYIGEVQPYMAQIQRQAPDWLDTLAQLSAPPTSSASLPLQAYRQKMLIKDTADGLWSRYQQAVKQHTQQWQRLLKRCGLSPGQSSAPITSG